MLDNEEVHEYGEVAPTRERYTNWRRASWGAIFAGLLVALIVFLTLQILGAGIGLAAIDLTGRQTSDPTAWGIGTVVWWFITGIVSLFVGGWVAGRLGWLPNKTDRILHGLTVWAAFYVVMLWLLTTTLSTVVGGTLSAVGQGLSTTAQTAATATQGQGLTPEAIQQELGGAQQAGGDLVNAVTEYFRGPQTAQERQRLAQAIAQSTGVSETQANQTISNLEQSAQQAGETGEQVADIAGTTFIVLAMAMILNAVAAALGGLFVPEPRHVLPRDYGRTRREEAHAGTYAR